MPINLQSAANFWARIKGDAAASGDGTSSSVPARYDTWNSDIGSQDDSSAGSDTGTSSLIALIKRLLGTKIPTGLTVTSTRLLVDNSGVIQPVSGTITANLGTISTASTAANQATTNTSLASILTNTGNIPANLTVTSNRLQTDSRLTVTTCTPSNVTVTSTSSTATSSNSSRVSLVIVNTGINDVTIRRSATAVVAGTGIVLKAGGGTYEINASNLYTGAITAITAAGSSTLAIEECV
jgi:hypothetical protein